MLSAVAIIPAHNEAPRIAAVIRPILQSGAVRRVLVVDDGSIDDTATVARAAGAQVLTLTPSRGKGQAMLAGLRATTEPVVLFADADLLGLRPFHIDNLLAPVTSGRSVMCAGLRDYGPVNNKLQLIMPRITGERAVLRNVLMRVPESFWSGFRIEAGINAVAKRAGSVCDTLLLGVAIVPKWNKAASRDSFVTVAKMTREVLLAMAEAERIP